MFTSFTGANLSILVRFCNNKYNFQFPCPSGVFIFSIVNALDKYFELTLLPSPSGVSIFSMGGERMPRVALTTVSVPFRGFYLLNPYQETNSNQEENGFRPLPRFLSSQSYPSGAYDAGKKVFPSPSGVSIFSMGGERMPRVALTTVSVPFRGFYLLNAKTYPSDSALAVSVPFRGFYLLNYELGAWDNEYEFPSPSGVSIFSILSLNLV